MSRGHIAFIDDEADLCAAAEDWLTASGFTVTSYSDPLQALAAMNLATLDAVLVDLRMPGMSGDQLLRELRGRDPDLPVILMSAHADVTAAVAAMREGAHDFLEKPYLPEHLVAVLDRAGEWRQLRRDLARAHAPQSRQDRVEQALTGRSPAILALRHAVLQLADAPVDLLISGPAGSGREALARLIHDLSRRARRPFAALDCRAIDREAMEAELFGYERGTHASRSGERASRFEHAQGGTIYLAEIEALAPDLQMRLFRTLQDRSVTRGGGHQARPIDTRVIAATSSDLEVAMSAGQFRPDLYFRLSSAALRAPALAERREDLAQLYIQALSQSAARLKRPLPDPSPATLEALKDRPWNGNLAELQAEAERHVLGIGTGQPVAGSAAGEAPTGQKLRPEGESLASALARYETALIREALEEAEGSVLQAAAALQLPRRTLNEKITRFGLREC